MWTPPYNLIKIIGTGLSLYGRTGPGGGILHLVFDGKTDLLYLNTTVPSTDSTLLWHAKGLGDGDHEVICWTTALNGNDVQGIANVWIDYFEWAIISSLPSIYKPLLGSKIGLVLASTPSGQAPTRQGSQRRPSLLTMRILALNGPMSLCGVLGRMYSTIPPVYDLRLQMGHR